MQDGDKTKEQLINELVELRFHLKEIEEKRRQDEDLQRILAKTVETLPEGIIISDPECKIMYVNRAVERLLGCKRKELIGMDAGFLNGENGRNRWCLETTPTRNNGGVCLEDLEILPLFEDDGELVARVAIQRNVTMRRQAEEALRISEERFNKVFNASPGLLVITTLDGRYIHVNNNFLRTTGYTREEVIGRTAIELGLYVDPAVRSRGMQEFLDNRGIYNQEVYYRMKSGEVRIGMSSAELIELGGEQCILAIIIDITERNQMEKELARLEQLNLVSEMAAGIGHEIRNPMTAVRGFLQMLSGKEECAKYKDFYDLMIEELDRANSIVTEFLSLARNKPLDLKVQNLNSIVKAMYPLIQADAMNANKGVAIDLNVLPYLLLDEREVRQLILNLVRNGLESMNQGGKLTIRTFTDSGEVVLSIQDQGKGIEPELLEKIGTPFFTTKEKGTGLGLAVCYGIAARHNATISLETGPTGSTFFVRFKITKK